MKFGYIHCSRFSFSRCFRENGSWEFFDSSHMVEQEFTNKKREIEKKNQLTLKCTVRSAWMHCKEKKQKNQLAVKCTTRLRND